GVPRRVRDDALQVRKLRPQPTKAAADAVARKALVVPVPAEERPLRVLQGELLRELHHRRREVHDPGLLGLLPGLVLAEDPEAALGVEVLGRHASDLARPTAGLVEGEDELAERFVPDRLEYLLLLGLREDAVTAAHRRLLHAAKRALVHDSLFLRPLEAALDG